MMPTDVPRALLKRARQTFRQGSQSFAAAALLFDPATRRDATLLYAWCRHCDDMIDGQELGRGQIDAIASPVERLRQLEQQTQRAFSGAAMDDPVFEGLQHVVRRHAIPEQLAYAHLEGYRMDVEERVHETIEDTLDYCYHVAGVVGLMMAHVMGVRDPAVLSRACDLGIAFQLTNIARDVVDDVARGRIYLPRSWLAGAALSPETMTAPDARPRLTALAARLLGIASDYYASAHIGIGALPLRSAWAIASALGIYQRIGTEILSRGERAWDGRAHTTGARKAALIIRGGVIALGRGRIGTGASARVILDTGSD